MPVITASIDPVTRIEGHLKIDIQLDKVNDVQQIVDAHAVGTLFRGFEKILENRDPRDATLITSRICGVCPTSHSLASVLALDAACGVAGDTPERNNARLLRNLVHAACFLESHLLHFYLLSLPDYVAGLPVAPWLPGWESGARVDHRTADQLTAHFREAIRMRRLAHEIGAVFGGRLPHTPAYVAGGFTAVPTAADQQVFSAGLSQITNFIERAYLHDAELLASLFPEYFHLGKGPGNLLSFGAFEMDNTASAGLFFPRGWKTNPDRAIDPVDFAELVEHVSHSWYEDQEFPQHPANEDTQPRHPKTGAYSWIKAPRYQGLPAECGPLARMTIKGDYGPGISVMDRHLARAREAHQLAMAMGEWLQELRPGTAAYTPCTIPEEFDQAVGIVEAPRGALGHWLRIRQGKIARYQVVTPTCWNVSPRDQAGIRGPLEEALIQVPVANVDQPIEALRIIHSFDPCLDCATHVTRVTGNTRRRLSAVNLGSPGNNESVQ